MSNVKKHRLMAWNHGFADSGRLRVDQLPDALIAWLNEHPNVEVVHIDKRIENVGEDWIIIYREHE